jgi:hypothetical protein
MQHKTEIAANRISGYPVLVILLAGLTSVLVISIIILSSVPPVCRDSLTHHLAVPKLYLNHGRMYEIPSVIFSYYPMNLELLYLVPLYFGNDIVPKYIHFIFALLTAFLVYGYLKERLNAFYALFGSLFFLSIPVIVKLSITVYVDLGLIFFSTASVIFLFKWIEKDFRLKHLFFSALFCGLALGTKYNALVVFFLLSIFVMFACSRLSVKKEKRSDSIRKSKQISLKSLYFGVFYIFIALLVFSPWMIRNYVWTKNPVYPLYQGFFSRINVPAVPVVRNADDNSAEVLIKNNRRKEWSNFAVRRIIYNESLTQTLLVPIRIFFEGEDGNPKYFDGKLSPFLFMLPFFAFFRIKQDNPAIRLEKVILLLFSILFILFAFAKTDMRIRYITPVIPPLVILSVMGVHNAFSLLGRSFSGLSNRMLSCCLFFIFAVIVSINGIYVLQQFRLVNPVDYLRGNTGRDEYIEKYRPEYAAIKYANSNISEDAKILCFFLGNRRYYSDREMLFDENLLIKSVKSSDAPNMIVSSMKKKGISHFLIWYGIFDKWVNNNFSEHEKVLLSKFFKENTTLLFSKGGYGLFELK